MVRRLFRRRRFTEAAARNLIANLTRERDAAFQAGFDLGFDCGLEVGLRQVLADARLALGEVA
jgi:hypothetical protein